MKLSLTTKFFLNLLVAIGIVVISMVFLIQYSFNRGFLNYVNTIEEKQLETLAGSLEKVYGETGGWGFVRDNPRILNNFLKDFIPEELHSRRNFGFSRPGGPGGPQGPPPPLEPGMANRPPPHDVPEGTRPFGARIVLMDGDGKHTFRPSRSSGPHEDH
jgi:two-component system sensor histidine kinase BaeS